MRALLTHAMKEMYQEKNPFTFLMPANPAIYEPFDFRYVYERPVWEFKDETFPLLVLEPLIGTKKIVKIELPQEKTREYIGKELKAAWTEAFHWSGIKNQVAEDNVQIEKQQRLLTIKSVSGSIEENTEINIYQKLADFANQWLAVHADIYVYRDASYYEMQVKESKAQNGDIFLVEEHEEIVGFFLYAREGDEIFVQEVMEQEEGLFSFLQIQPQKKPIIMARIVHLEEMLKLVRSSEHKTILLEVKDKLIQENTGLYLWEITPTGSLVSCIEKQSEDISLSGNDTTKDENISIDIGELTPYLFGRVFINEIV